VIPAALAPSLAPFLALYLVGNSGELTVHGPAPSPVIVGEPHAVVFERTGMEATDLLGLAAPLPVVRGLGIEVDAAAAVAGSREVIADGRLASESYARFGLLVTPHETGTIALPEILLRSGGREFATPPLEIAATTAGESQEHARIGFVTVEARPSEVRLGETFTLVLRFGVETSLSDARLVPLFARRLDLPLRIVAPQLEPGSFAGAIANDDESGGEGVPHEGSTFALGDRTTTALPLDDVDVDGVTYRAFEVARTFVAVAESEIDLAPPRLQLAFATRFAEDLIAGRVPLDRREVRIEGRAGRLAIRPLPALGRPAGFVPLVGRFHARAVLDVARVTAGESFELRVEIEALEGTSLNSVFAPPAIVLPGFAMLGVLERSRGGGVVTFAYDVIALDAGLDALPALAIDVFDPRVVGYSRLVTDAQPLRVDPPRDAAAIARLESLRSAERGGASDPASRSGAARRPRSVLLVFLVPLAILSIAYLARRRRAAPRDERRHLAEEIAARCAREEAVEPREFLAYLALVLEASDAEIGGSSLRERLAAKGVGDDLARRVLAVVAATIESRYAGRGQGSDASSRELRELVAALEAHFRV
jgi:hypothetical protein